MGSAGRSLAGGLIAGGAIVFALSPAIVLLFPATGADLWTRATRGLGHTALSLLFLHMLLSARVPLLDRVYGADRMIRVHRVSGAVLAAIVAFHAASGLFKLSGLGDRLDFRLPPFGVAFSGAAAAALVACAAAVGAMQARFKASYEEWRGLHRIAYYALPAALLHVLLAGVTKADPLVVAQTAAVAVTAIAAIAHRGARYVEAARRPLRVTAVISRAADVTSLRFAKPEGFRFRPGQFCEIATRGEPSHPFTISSGTADRDLEVTARAIGDFTGSWPLIEPGAELIVTGPLGRLTPDRVVCGPHAALLAGGIGITVFASMLRSDGFWSRPGLESATLLWSVRAAPALPFLDEIAAVTRKRPLSAHVLVTGSDGPAASTARVVEEAGLAVIGTGRISRSLIEHAGIVARPDGGSYVLCGPDGFMRLCRRLLRQAGVRGDRIFEESFRL